MWAQVPDNYTLSIMMKALHWWHDPQKPITVLPQGLWKTPIWHHKAFRMNPLSSFSPRGRQHLQANRREVKVVCVLLKETVKETKWGMFSGCFLCIINRLLQWILPGSGPRVLIKSWLCQKLSSSPRSRVHDILSHLTWEIGSSSVLDHLFFLSLLSPPRWYSDLC